MAKRYPHYNDAGELLTRDQAITDAVADEATITFNVIANPLVKVTASMTLPAAGGTYAAQDEISNHATGGSVTPLNFADVAAANGGTGYIVKAVIETSTAVVANAILRLWLFSVSPTAYGNDSPLQIDYADRAKRVGYIDFALLTEGTGSDGAYALDDGIRLAFKTDAADRDLYGLLEAKAGYVWGAAQTFEITLLAELA